MQIQINPSDGLPIYRQIVVQITDAIAGGALPAGEKLPSHRELAARLVIAPLTVKKAYDELELTGLLETRRGRGTFVAERLPPADPDEGRERLREPVRQLLGRAALAGMGFEALVKLMREIRREMNS